MKALLGIVLIFILFIFFGTTLLFERTVQLDISNVVNLSESVSVLRETQEIAKEIVTPPPLRKGEPATFPEENDLTRLGIIENTNERRQNNDLQTLSENAVLDSVAKVKLDDMFEEQYFAHVSPSGDGPSDIVEDLGYGYIVVGENLAMGNFKDDEEVVQAWMDSPGHRENILGPRYQEIGVAVGKDVFEGRTVWVAVQTFALPLSVCSEPSKEDRASIESAENEVELFQAQASLILKEIEGVTPRGREEIKDYNSKVSEYNSVVAKINSVIQDIKILAAEYNAQVQTFNECLVSYTSS